MSAHSIIFLVSKWHSAFITKQLPITSLSTGGKRKKKQKNRELVHTHKKRKITQGQISRSKLNPNSFHLKQQKKTSLQCQLFWTTHAATRPLQIPSLIKRTKSSKPESTWRTGAKIHHQGQPGQVPLHSTAEQRTQLLLQHTCLQVATAYSTHRKQSLPHCPPFKKLEPRPFTG